MAKRNDIPERPGLLITRFFKGSPLSKTYKNPAEWLCEATKLSPKFCKQLISGKAKLTQDNANKIASVSGLKLHPTDLLIAEMKWRPYYDEKHPKPTETPDRQIVAALRAMWLRSVERITALKNSNYCCEKCAVKQSKVKGKEIKLDVHHRSGHINWPAIIAVVRKELLHPASQLQTLCRPCHDQEHE